MSKELKTFWSNISSYKKPNNKKKQCRLKYKRRLGGACGVMVIAVRNGHGETSSNPRRGWLHFT